MFTTILIQPLANGLILFYNVLWQNMGLAIVGFSIFLRIILNPLTKPYLESAKKMKDLNPLIEKLKVKYAGDKMGMAKAQADLYKEKGINPGAGCLPYLLQIVILIAFFNVFSRTLYPNKNIVQEFNKLLYPPLQFVEAQKINTNFLYLDIVKPDVFKINGLPFGIPGPILILSALFQLASSLMMVPYEKQQEKIAKKTKEKTDDMQVMMQKSMMFTFPLFTIIFGLSFPSGLALYWLIFSIFQVFQQYRMSGLGGLTPWLKKLNLIKSPAES